MRNSANITNHALNISAPLSHAEAAVVEASGTSRHPENLPGATGQLTKAASAIECSPIAMPIPKPRTVFFTEAQVRDVPPGALPLMLPKTSPALPLERSTVTWGERIEKHAMGEAHLALLTLHERFRLNEVVTTTDLKQLAQFFDECSEKTLTPHDMEQCHRFLAAINTFAESHPDKEDVIAITGAMAHDVERLSVKNDRPISNQFARLRQDSDSGKEIPLSRLLGMRSFLESTPRQDLSSDEVKYCNDELAAVEKSAGRPKDERKLANKLKFAEAITSIRRTLNKHLVAS